MVKKENVKPRNATDGNSSDVGTRKENSFNIEEYNQKVIRKKGYPQNNNISRVYSNSEYQKMASSQYVAGIRAVFKELGYSGSELNGDAKSSPCELISGFRKWNEEKISRTDELKEKLSIETTEKEKYSKQIEEFEMKEIARSAGVKDEFIDYSIYQARKKHSDYASSDMQDDLKEKVPKSMKDVFEEIINENGHLRKNASSMKSYKVIKSEPIQSAGYVEKLHRLRQAGNLEMASKMKAEAAMKGLYLR